MSEVKRVIPSSFSLGVVEDKGEQGREIIL